MIVAGLLLAAGAGRRMGGPKALVELDGELLVRRALRVLAAGGAGPLTVVVGAESARVRAAVAGAAAVESTVVEATVVEAADWVEGMGASLRAGLLALEATSAEAAVVHLVDLPGVTPEAVARLVSRGSWEALARAAYGGAPGHPVLLGRAHWPAVRGSAVGDAGARGYLRGNPAVELVECGDVATPDDVDTPGQLRRAATPPRE